MAPNEIIKGKIAETIVSEIPQERPNSSGLATRNTKTLKLHQILCWINYILWIFIIGAVVQWHWPELTEIIFSGVWGVFAFLFWGGRKLFGELEFLKDITGGINFFWKHLLEQLTTTELLAFNVLAIVIILPDSKNLLKLWRDLINNQLDIFKK